jgi:hypothetical protein
MLGKIQTVNNGQQTLQQMVDPITGKVTETGRTQMMQTPDSVASIANTKEQNALTRGVTIRGQNMTDSRSREKNAIDSGNGFGKPPAGYRFASDGSLEAISGGPADKLPDANQKQITGTKNLSNAIAEYKGELGNWNKIDTLLPDKRAAMGTKYNNMMLQAKEAYNLGVLNGPDLDILTSVITDPRSAVGAITSNEALRSQATELDRIMNDVASTTGNKVRANPSGNIIPKNEKMPSNTPKAGTVKGGYVFLGGDPANPKSWKKQ